MVFKMMLDYIRKQKYCSVPYRNDKVVTTLAQPWHNLDTSLPQCFFYNLVTTLSQPCILKLWQGCYKVVARLSQGCTNIVTRLSQCTLYFETVARLLQGGGKAVTRLYHNLVL